MREQLSNELLIEHMTQKVVLALQQLPGQTYLGRHAVKHRIVQPINEESLRAKFRAMIAKKVFDKTKNSYVQH